MTEQRCQNKVLQPSRVAHQCEFVRGVGFNLEPPGHPAAAFRWVLCGTHLRLLLGQLQELTQLDTAALAEAMGLHPRPR
jgi:hypothetical protein